MLWISVVKITSGNPLTKGCLYKDDNVNVLAIAHFNFSWISLPPSDIPENNISAEKIWISPVKIALYTI